MMMEADMKSQAGRKVFCSCPLAVLVLSAGVWGWLAWRPPESMDLKRVTRGG